MKADISILYRSEYCEVKNFICQCTDCALSAKEYQEKFSICFVRRGNFLFKIFKNELDTHNGYCLLNKPGYEHRVGHNHEVPDQCTIISFSSSFYEEIKEKYGANLNGFLRNLDCHSLLLKNDVFTEYIHHSLFSSLIAGVPCCMRTDTLILELVGHIFRIDGPFSHQRPGNHKQYLRRIEDAKLFIQSNFNEDLTLQQVATHAGMSVFHFARTFKTFTNRSPHDYLMRFRVHHAERLLKNTSLSIKEIASETGFNNPDYFSSAFKKAHLLTPLQYRNAKV